MSRARRRASAGAHWCSSATAAFGTPSHHEGAPLSESVLPIASWISPKARKGLPSGIAGRGLFAVEPIAAGDVVAVKGGHIVDTTTLLSLPPKLQNSEIQIAEGLHLVARRDDEYEAVMLFINHSCEIGRAHV